jgi:prevent-host-death family protein
VVTGDYIAAVKKKTPSPLYKQRMPALKITPETSGPMALAEAVPMPGVGLTIPVRAAKAKLSALLDLVASGQEVTITSDGRPKAVLRPVSGTKRRKVFTGMGDYLKTMPMQTEGPFADEIVRADRDGRGW